MRKKYNYYLTFISWIFATGLYYLIGFYGSDNWPIWVDGNSTIYGSWLLVGVLLGGVHGWFYQIIDSFKFRRIPYGTYIGIQIIFVFGFVLFVFGVDLVIEIILEDLHFTNYWTHYLKNIMDTFFTADPHFGHYNIISHCDRPWNNMEHDEALIQRWNAVVNKKDVVYVLGDFAMFKRIGGGGDTMKMYRKTRAALNGKINLILGNHDKMSQETYNCFSNVYPGIKDIKIEGQKVTLCHYPMRSWNCSFHGEWHLFGHVHGRLEKVDTDLSFDVGVDVPDWNYTPVDFDRIKKKMKVKEKGWNEKYNRV